MASSRPSGFKKGGGFLNNVDATLVDYQFTDEFNGTAFVPGKDPKTKKDKFHGLNVLLTVRQDGSEENETTTLRAGAYEDFEVSDDGHTLTPIDDSIGLRASSDWSRFIASLCEAGFDENNLPGDGEPINYEAILGQRVRLVQVDDTAAMQRAAKNWQSSGGRFDKDGNKKGKDGKYYKLKSLAVEAVLEPSTQAAAPAKGKPAVKAAAGKPVAGATKPAGGKPNGKVEEDLTQLADETLLAILADNDGSILKSKLPVKVNTKLGIKHPNREDVRKIVYSDEYLVGATERGIIAYNPADKTQTIEAA